jgi:xanthine dehydrogenase iron-sulfur cluster and FAD-binding subunit A
MVNRLQLLRKLCRLPSIKWIRLTSDILPTTTLLDCIRDTVKLTGKKESYSEGNWNLPD